MVEQQFCKLWVLGSSPRGGSKVNFVSKSTFIFSVVLFTACFAKFAYANSTTIQIIIAPHFDDAVLPLGGMLAESNANKIAITLFAGNPKEKIKTFWDYISGFISNFVAVPTREKENDLALNVLDTKEENLDFLDGQYRSTKYSKNLEGEIESKIKSSIQKLQASSTVEVYGPAYFGPDLTHIDHKIVHEAILNLVRSKSFPKVKWYFFEDLPYTIHYLKSTTTPILKFISLENKDLKITEKSIFLSKDALDKKASSLSAYKSQLKAFKKVGDSLVEIIDFNKSRCKPNACEKVYRVEIK